MNRLNGLWTRIRRAFGSRAFEAQMADEMREHLEQEIARRVKQGESPEQARRHAAIEFGRLDTHKERVRDRRLGRVIEQTCRDLRYAARWSRRSPGFAAAVIITLGLAIGLNATVFTFVHTFLFKPVPVENGERLVTVADANLPRTNRPAIAWPDYLEYRDGNQTFEMLEAGVFGLATITEPNKPPEQFARSASRPGF